MRSSIRRRTRGLTVALLGPDGAGKSTLAAAIAGSIPGARVLYVGLWQRPRAEEPPLVPGSDLVRRLALVLRVRILAGFHRVRGLVVVLDRHPFDALLGIEAGQGRRDRLYFGVLARSLPAPDVTVVLDLPGSVAHDRKGEHDAERLEADRRAYRRLAVRTPGAVLVDATQSSAQVHAEVLALIAARRADAAAPRPSSRAAALMTSSRAPAPKVEGLSILVVTPGMSYPPSDGFSLRVHGLVRELAARHRVTLVRFDGDDGEACRAALAPTGIEVRLVQRTERHVRRWRWLSALTTRSYRSRYYHDPALQAEIDNLLRSRPFDAVQVESTELWAYDLGGVKRPPIVLDTHNIHRELLRRITATQPTLLGRVYWWLEAAKFAREERRFWRSVDACVMTSARETAIVARTAGVRIAATVPNGVDLEAFRPSPAPPGRLAARDPELVFTGLLSYRPNEDAVRFFVRDVLPLIRRRVPAVRLTVVGKEVPASLTALGGPDVTFTGWVDDVRPYLARAAAVVVPLRAGSGTRLKILEALAMGRGVVSTSLGCEGLDVTSGQELLIADEPAAFADAVVELMADPGVADRLGIAGRALVEREHGWPAAAAALEDVYARLIDDLGRAS